MKKKERDQEERIKQEGKKAAEEGKSKEDCPYNSIMNRAAWFWGYSFLAAKKDSK